MLIDRINLENDEEILATTRRHKFLIILQSIAFFFVALVPYFLLVLLQNNQDIFPFSLSEYSPLIVYVYAVWLLFIWIAAFIAWTDYYLDVLVVTNHRLVITNQKGFWRRSLSSFRLERLQEVNVEIDGIVPTLLDFGTLRAETAGHGEEEFHMDSLPNPRALKEKIMGAVEQRENTVPSR